MLTIKNLDKIFAINSQPVEVMSWDWDNDYYIFDFVHDICVDIDGDLDEYNYRINETMREAKEIKRSNALVPEHDRKKYRNTKKH
jgi:hypothetical protein